MAIKNPKFDKMLRDLAIDAQNKKFEQMGLYFTTCSAFGIPWWTWYWMIGARGRGKSYAALETVLQFMRKYGQENVKCYYFRISDTSVKAMLADKGRKAVDAKLKRKYNLELEVHNYSLYNNGKPFIDFYPLVSAAKKGKGVAEYDPEFLGNQPEGVRRFIFLLIDEFMIDETQEKRTIGNPVKQFKMYFENIMRDQEQLDYRAVMVLGCANNVAECNDFLAEICGFIPSAPGRYKLKRKHMIIDMIPNSQAYIEKRKKSIGADIMGYDEDENYTNIIKRDLETLMPHGTRLRIPTRIIKFSKEKKDWFTVWDGNIIKKYTNQPFKSSMVTSMKRYLDNQFDPEKVLQVIQMQDARFFKFSDLMSQASFISNLKLIRK
nr:MAG TPA: Terminase [Bacteriophage sp.]